MKILHFIGTHWVNFYQKNQIQIRLNAFLPMKKKLVDDIFPCVYAEICQKSDSNPFKYVFADEKNSSWKKYIYPFQHVYANICKNLIQIRFNAYCRWKKSRKHFRFKAFMPIYAKIWFKYVLTRFCWWRLLKKNIYIRFNAFMPIYAKFWFKSV